MLVSFCPVFAQSPATSHPCRERAMHAGPTLSLWSKDSTLPGLCFGSVSVTASVTESLDLDIGAALPVSSCCLVSALSDVPRFLCGPPSLVLRVTQSPVSLPGVNCYVFTPCMLIFHRSRGCLLGGDPADAEKRLA